MKVKSASKVFCHYMWNLGSNPTYNKIGDPSPVV